MQQFAHVCFPGSSQPREVTRVPARHLAQDAFHPAVLATMLVIHIQLDNFFGVGRQLDPQVFEVEEDRVVQQAV